MNKLKRDTSELRERLRNNTLNIADINIKLPVFLDSVSVVLGGMDSISNSIAFEKISEAIINGEKKYFSEDQINDLRNNNDANLFMDIPQKNLTVKIPNCDKIVDLDKLPHPVVKILKCGMSHPGSPFPSNLFNSPDTLKSYVYAARKQLNDNKKPYVIKTCKKIYFPEGGYYFNPALRYIIIKTENSPSFNPKSTSP